MFKNILVVIGFFLTLSSAAQDPQLSQYYNAPLYLNPAFTGAGLDTRAGLNYRMQWPGLGDPYKTFSAWIDHDFYKKRSGLGLLINRSTQGAAKLSATDISALYSYQINLTERWTAKTALQGGIGIRDFDFGKAVFGDQLANDGTITGSSTDQLATGKTRIYPDFSVGTVVYNRNLWLGISANHINRPNQSFTQVDKVPLPVKWSFIGGYKILLGERQIAWGAPVMETSITPTFLYKKQGTSDQLDLGLYLTHHPVMAGIWYRGLPVKKYASGVPNSESLVLMAGLIHKGFTFCYSYDLVVSKLAGLSGGAHELSLIYQWQTDKSNRKGKRGHRTMPCPNVDRQYKTFHQ
ncbi:MAG TPA: type IX secretion system membrane protein PorP/SprF [Cytophagaceae bacterium]|nr:type IX secretion system membrane protein PorP/SprF [Cytophagaceae bacterium]